MEPVPRTALRRTAAGETRHSPRDERSFSIVSFPMGLASPSYRSLTFPVEDLRHGLFERYAEGVDVVAAALRRVGVEAEGGEVAGEFCPGAYSVRSGGPRGIKHAGLAQRVT
ncbi:MAG TPA: hypothetical protein VG127_05335, partial [Rubrobacteraceae bacterium]|nr:hypothetical protein [Rubrobacteraceae bacterium]